MKPVSFDEQAEAILWKHFGKTEPIVTHKAVDELGQLYEREFEKSIRELITKDGRINLAYLDGVKQ
jgi:hypothetical protein